MGDIARLNVCCHDVIEIFKKNRVSGKELSTLEELLTKKEQFQMLEIALGYRRSMAFLDHEELTEKLFTGFRYLEEGYKAEIKNTFKKLKLFQADPKADPAAVARMQSALDVATASKSKTSVITGKFSF